MADSLDSSPLAGGGDAFPPPFQMTKRLWECQPLPSHYQFHSERLTCSSLTSLKSIWIQTRGVLRINVSSWGPFWPLKPQLVVCRQPLLFDTGAFRLGGRPGICKRPFLHVLIDSSGGSRDQCLLDMPSLKGIRVESR